MRYYDSYVANGLGGGDQVFLEVIKAAGSPAVDFGGAADRAGGLAKPNFNISGLSCVKGPVGGALATAQSGNFDPKDFFGGGGGPLLFGVFNLFDVVSGTAPKFLSESLNALAAFASDAARFLVLAEEAGKSGGTATLNAAQLSLGSAVGEVQKALDALDLANSAPTILAFPALAAKATGLLDALLNEARALPLPKSLINQLESRATVLADLLSVAGPVQKTLAAIGPTTGLVDSLQRTRLEWSPTLTSFPNDPAAWIFGVGSGTRFTMSVEMRQASGDEPPGSISRPA